MTWQLSSFLLLGIALASGFAWFERSRPSARVVSMVAALAALAVVGRIAFAAFPNVKPTTDIVLFAGYALGPVPGFVTGALTALASNVFFGQGPWTPWQMTAWGLVGIGGGLLGRAMRGREPGRLRLAAACGVAGLGFGALMDAYQWSFTAEQTLDSYRVVAETSLPYNLAHAIGNVAFCLAIGPAFVRALERCRERFDVRWQPVAAASLLALAIAAGASVPPSATAATASSERAVRYLDRAQNGDGGFGAVPGRASNQLYSGWAALGLAAAGRSPADFARGRTSLLEYLRRGSGSLNDTGELERTILALGASARDARDFAGRDLVAQLLRRQRADGSFDGFVNLTAFGVLAARAGGLPANHAAVRRAARFLTAAQGSDGGFGIAPGQTGDVDITGAVVQALATAGQRGRSAARRAVRFLAGAQGSDGGFGQRPGSPSNAQSTAFAIQGLVAGGRSPASVRRAGRTPLSYLRSLQDASGLVRYSRTSTQTPVWVTSQALLGFEQAPLPLRPVRSAPRRRTAAPATADPAPAGDGEGKERDRSPRRERRRRGRTRRSVEPGAVVGEDVTTSAPRANARPRRASADDDGGVPPVLAASAAALMLAGAGWWWRGR